MSSKKKTNEVQKKPDYIWDSYISKCVSVYMMVFMTVFILFCREGYVQYDLHKRNLFYGISLIFIFSFLLISLLSLSTNERRPWKELFSKMDLWLVGILGTWVIGWFFSENRSYAFWGDPYRYIGLSYLGLGVITMWIISRYVEWNVWLTRVFVGVCSIIFIWQTMNCYYIDLPNWTMDQANHALMSTLANINQNACFNVLVLSAGMVMFLFAKEKKDKILFGIFLLLGYIGGISTTSDTYYIGIGIVFLALVVYVLRHSEYLWDFWVEAALFVLAALLQKIGTNVYTGTEVTFDSLSLFMTNGMVLIGFGALLAVTALLIWKAKTFFGKHGRLISNIYMGFLGFLMVVFIGCVIYANVKRIDPESGGLLAKLVITDLTGSFRGLIWRATLSSYARESFVHRIFGCGLNNYSGAVYPYFVQELNAVFGEQTVLADAHNVLLDMMISSGTVGVICFFGLPIQVFIQCIRLVKTNPVCLYGILGFVAWIAIGLLNSNLNIAVQVFFVMLGVYWGILRKLERGEEVGGTVKLV